MEFVEGNEANSELANQSMDFGKDDEMSLSKGGGDNFFEVDSENEDDDLDKDINIEKEDEQVQGLKIAGRKIKQRGVGTGHGRKVLAWETRADLKEPSSSETDAEIAEQERVGRRRVGKPVAHHREFDATYNPKMKKARR